MSSLFFLIFALIILLLGVVILVYGFYYSKVLSRLNQVQKQNLYLRFHIQEKSLEKINTAKDKSLKIITDATSQAEEILKRAEVLKTDTNENARQELEALSSQQKEFLTKASDDLVGTFKEAIEQSREEDINVLKNITKDIEHVAENEVKEFEKQLRQETIGQENIVDKKIQEAFAKAQEEIDIYKKSKIAEIDQDIYTILQAVTKDVIGKHLSFQDQKDLIMAALERAKSEMMVR
jgi:hypothetical protein